MMQFDTDADFEATVTTLLTERADRAVVEPDVHLALADPPGRETDPGGPTRWWLAVAAVSIAVAGIGFASRGGVLPAERIGSTAEPAAGQAAVTNELIVWMEVGVDAAQVRDLADLLGSSASVDGFVYIDQAATWSAFVDHFADEPEIIGLVEPEQLPTSFVVRAEAPGPVIQLVTDQPGVDEIEIGSPEGETGP